VSLEELRRIDLARALARFRTFPDDIRIALDGDKPFAGVAQSWSSSMVTW
jgi:hypothetical protein